MIVAESSLQEETDRLLTQDGIDSVTVTAEDSPAAPRRSPRRHPAQGPRHPCADPTVVDGDVLLQATLSDAPDSSAAEQTVRDVRADFASQDLAAVVGGPTATSIDTNDASAHDRTLIIPVVLVVIVLILMLLLRSILAPILLVATTVLSFGTAMGVAALVFNHLFDFPGADPAVPLYGFVFLVALGIDYNIF